ncbi:uncharacterized protein [Centruroides vittatus]|uniref:uncharacterized protein n=1 Tax=Centruroides vittatus TaxID=120091 RepID=UPI0035108CC6
MASEASSPPRIRPRSPESGPGGPDPSGLRYLAPFAEADKLRSIRPSLPSDFLFTIFLEGQGPLRRLRPAELHAALRTRFPRPELIEDVRYSRSGLLLLKTRDFSTAQTALALTSLGDLSVWGRLAPECSQTAYLLRGVDVSLTASEIYEMLTEAMLPVVEVRRFTRKLNDRAEVTPSTTVYFSIASADPIESVKLYYQRFRCERFYPKPRFCGRCLTFGHAPASCRGRRRCLNCGEDHDSTGCSRPAEKCVRCRGPHRADSPNCPAYLSEARLLKLSVIHRCSHAEAKRLRPCGAIILCPGGGKA